MSRGRLALALVLVLGATGLQFARVQRTHAAIAAQQREHATLQAQEASIHQEVEGLREQSRQCGCPIP